MSKKFPPKTFTSMKTKPIDTSLDVTLQHPSMETKSELMNFFRGAQYKRVKKITDF